MSPCKGKSIYFYYGFCPLAFPLAADLFDGQGEITHIHPPRAMPWAMSFCPFGALSVIAEFALNYNLNPFSPLIRNTI